MEKKEKEYKKKVKKKKKKKKIRENARIFGKLFVGGTVHVHELIHIIFII